MWPRRSQPSPSPSRTAPARGGWRTVKAYLRIGVRRLSRLRASPHEIALGCAIGAFASITPLLKNTLDWVSHVREPLPTGPEVFKTRVFALGSSSNGGMGGLRSLTTVRQVLELGLGALVLPDQFAVPRAKEAYGEDGHLKNKDSQETFKALIQKLARAAHVLHG